MSETDLEKEVVNEAGQAELDRRKAEGEVKAEQPKQAKQPAEPKP